MSISRIAILTFGMAILASSVLISNQAYAGIEPPLGDVTRPVAGIPIPVD